MISEIVLRNLVNKIKIGNADVKILDANQVYIRTAEELKNNPKYNLVNLKNFITFTHKTTSTGLTVVTKNKI